MKTKEFNVERNYRIDNSDQYAKARFNQIWIKLRNLNLSIYNR